MIRIICRVGGAIALSTSPLLSRRLLMSRFSPDLSDLPTHLLTNVPRILCVSHASAGRRAMVELGSDRRGAHKMLSFLEHVLSASAEQPNSRRRHRGAEDGALSGKGGREQTTLFAQSRKSRRAVRVRNIVHLRGAGCSGAGQVVTCPKNRRRSHRVCESAFGRGRFANRARLRRRSRGFSSAVVFTLKLSTTPGVRWRQVVSRCTGSWARLTRRAAVEPPATRWAAKSTASFTIVLQGIPMVVRRSCSAMGALSKPTSGGS